MVLNKNHKNQWRIIALTGSIGSGKSTVAELFKNLGCHIIDADVLARSAVESGKSALREICNVFGDTVLDESGSLNRKKLGEVVFQDPQAKQKLENILHPQIRSLFLVEKKRYIENDAKDRPICLYVIPLYFESNYKDADIEKVIVVSATDEACIARIMDRDDCTKEEAARKLSSQLPTSYKEARADFIIKNNESLEDLSTSVKVVYDALLRDFTS